MNRGRIFSASLRCGLVGVLLAGQPVVAGKHATDLLLDAIEQQVTPNYSTFSTPEAGNLPNSHLLTELALSRLTVSDKITPESTELFGDKIDLNTGGLSL